MKFKDFLDSLLPGDNVLPIDKLKTDLETFKAAFNYAEKTDEIYNNLIDNIVKLLRIKFGEYEIIYTSPNVMYNELLITLNPQLPQFLMIQKKQLIESLDTFGNLNNWGDVLKDNVKRALNLSDVSANQTSYVPIDGANKDPYSVNDVDNRREQSETTDVSRLATDYLTFYKKIRWNIASIELNKIYADYIKLFKIYYQYDSNGLTVNGNVYDQVQQNSKNIEMLAEELDNTNHQVGTNTSNIVLNANNIQTNLSSINQNKNDLNDLSTKVDNNVLELTNKITANTTNITNNTQSIAAINTNLNNYYQKSESDNRFGTLTQQQTNTQNIQTNQNNIAQITHSLQSANFVLYKGVYSSTTTYNLADAVTFNNNWYVSNQANNLNHTPQNTSDAYWELLTTPPSVNLANYYTIPQADAKFATIQTTNDLSGRIGQLNSIVQNDYLEKTIINTLFPVGSNVMTTNGQIHALVVKYPTKFRELTDNDIAYLAIGNNSSSSNSSSFTINQNNLPNINWQWKTDWNTSMTPTQTNMQAYVVSGSASMEHYYIDAGRQRNSGTNANDGLRASVYTRVNLNGNVSQNPITYTMKPKTLKIRMWEVIANII